MTLKDFACKYFHASMFGWNADSKDRKQELQSLAIAGYEVFNLFSI